MNKIVINLARSKDTLNCVRYKPGDAVALVSDPYFKIDALLEAFKEIPDVIEITVIAKGSLT